MSLSRRHFLSRSAAALTVPAAVPLHAGQLSTTMPAQLTDRFDPWIEVDPRALTHNVREITRLSRERPILAVVKNNAYGLGLTTAAPVLDRLGGIAGFAVVKTDQAVALRDAGVTKPILLMGYFAEAAGPDLMQRNIEFAPFSEGVARSYVALSRQFGRPVPVHCYIDTGMSRLGMPSHKALPWVTSLAETPEILIRGMFTTFTEEDDFDEEQLSRFTGLAGQLTTRGIDVGRLHAASSHGLFFRPTGLLDMVRPGLLLYGAYPSGARALDRASLQPAFRLRARVVRVERLEAGESVSYGRNYVATEPTWIATLPVGHADGYPRRAVDGCEALINDRVYPVVGAVSASHTIVELGPEETVHVGDLATLLGPEHEAVHPNTIAERAGVSVYDVLMHLSAALPRWVV